MNFARDQLGSSQKQGNLMAIAPRLGYYGERAVVMLEMVYL
jgi:hypothetical protein